MIVEFLVSLTLLVWFPGFAWDVMRADEDDRGTVVLWSVINIAINVLFIFCLDVLTWGADHLYLYVACFPWGQLLVTLQLRLRRLPDANIRSTVAGLMVSVTVIGLFWLFNWMLWH